VRKTAAGSTFSNISGATNSTYVIDSSDIGYQIKAVVTATNGISPNADVDSTTTSTITQAPPVNTAVPEISGTAQTGVTLSVSNGTWSNSPTSYLYQWMSSATVGGVYSNIASATSATYVVVPGDVSRFIKASVAAVNAGGTSAYSTSVATSQVLNAAPAISSVPSVTGTAQTGQTLSVSNGSWSGSPTSYLYQWTRSLTSGGSYSSITSATSQTYVVTSSDVGYFIKGTVAGVNAGGTST
jgi:hypothetical protein